MNLNFLQSLSLVLSSLVLFIYGLEHFSEEIQRIGRKSLGDILRRWTSNRFFGFFLGAIFTGIIQSSSAVSSLAVALVDAQLLSFAGSLAVMLGTNVGTVVTAQLVAYKLTGLGAILIVFSALVSRVPKVKQWAKVIFYFGFVLFVLDLIGTYLGSMHANFDLKEYLPLGHAPYTAILYGAVLTALFQSSSVTTGLIILLVQQQQVSLEFSVPFILGSNIGTTSTALLASIKMSTSAKKAAVANLFFKVVGVIIFLPFLTMFTSFVASLTEDAATNAAHAHLLFNVISAVIFLPILGYFEKMIHLLWKTAQSQ
jgi:phosphate:Na+ symporter